MGGTCRKCDRPAAIKGFCKGHYNSRRTKWVRAGKWADMPSAVGSTRRVRALVALGWSQNELCRRTGLSPSTMSHIIRGSVDRTSTANAHTITRLYDELSMTPGPSDYHRAYARSRRWAPPLAWDDDLIDNPHAKPDLGERQSISWDERYLEMRELGFNDLEILGRLKVQPESMLRQLERYGLQGSPELVKLANSQKHRRKVSA